MLRWLPSLGVILAVTASVASAQDKPRPRVTVVIKSPTAGSTPLTSLTTAAATPGQPVLRKPLGLASSTADDPTPASPSLAFLAVAKADPKAPLARLSGLDPPSGSALAAQCRSSCAETRYTCTARESGDCDAVWGRCVVGCSGAVYARTPDLTQTPAARASR